MFAAHAAAESRRLTLPANADAYKFETTSGFKPPDGVEFTLKADDPRAAQARAWAQKHGLTQEAFSEALDLVAAGEVGNVQAMQTAREAEMKKLGANGTNRITALNTWLDAMGAPELKGTLWTEKIVTAYEKLMQRVASQGVGSPSANGRDPEPAGRLSDEAYGKLSFDQKLEYARKFPQPTAH